MSVTTFDKSGDKAPTAKLDSAIFDVTVNNHELLRQAYDAYLANGRPNLAIVKTRGLVSGGGKKPWRQKGTGRARFGSSRNPIWRGGGIVFGPTGEENYTKRIHTKAKRLALCQALSLASAGSKIIVIENLSAENGKTSSLARLLAKIGAHGRILAVVEDKTAELMQASANLRDIKLVQPSYLSVYDVMNADKVVITQAALQTVTDRLAAKSDDRPVDKPTAKSERTA